MELRLLIVEDDRLIAEAAADYFTGKGWLVQTTEDGLQVLELLKVRCFHLVLLDVMISGLDGFNVCRQIRKDCDVPIIFITARVLEEDKLNGYSLGADDYVTKPFSLPVLYAKAMALTGRVQGLHSFVELGGLKVDTRSRKVWRFGEILVLPPKEYEMLLFLIQNPGRVYSREQLLIRFWGYDFDGNERVVDNHIKKLRKALGSCGCTIETVRKFGYRLSEAKMEVVR
ncbi:response regulator [Lachnospiraceae bacterium WCA-9-b2]|uniref:Stage 0 sporulation protein A homolog n=1 Tax=Sporofaciens musculi TaxID=2681861 RepID=A0A7X3MJT9_9FIRM|nr:response regulator transcription factor [Sporofaciens musculi]MXP77639.1 response regulator [Sporofaciens musculi]